MWIVEFANDHTTITVLLSFIIGLLIGINMGKEGVKINNGEEYIKISEGIEAIKKSIREKPG